MYHEFQPDRRNALKLAGGIASAAAMMSASSSIAATANDDAPKTEFVMQITATLESRIDIGPSSYGIRRVIPITGGTFEGPKIKGTVVSGGADWQLIRPDGGTIIEALYMLKTDDGAHIIVHNKGLSMPTAEGKKKLAKGETLTAADRYVRVIPEFQAPIGPHDWLNQSMFVSTLTSPPDGSKAVWVRVFRIL